MRARWLWVSFPFLFASCPNDPPPKPKLDLLVRFSSFTKLFDGAAGEQPVGDERVQVGGVVNETLDFGGLVFIPPGEGPNAQAEVFSNDTGDTYWVSAQAPSAVLGQGAPVGNSAQLRVTSRRRTTRPCASS